MQMKKIATGALAGLAVLSLASCGGGDSGSSSSSSGGVTQATRFEAYCKPQGLTPALRQTFILVDAKALKKSALATEFAANNAFVRDVVLSFANPGLALNSGATAPRERISILLVPADGSPAQLVFTGCMPGLSADERAAASQSGSSISEFFTGDQFKELDKDTENFLMAVIGGLTAAAKSGIDAVEPQTGALGSTALFSSLRASRGALEIPKGNVGRLIVISDLSAATFESAEDKATPAKQGQDAGYKAGGDFGMSEVMVVQPPNSPLKGKDYLTGFLLAQGGDLTSFSSGKPGAGGRAPVKVRTFDGEAAYPSRTERVTIRIADDGKGNLTSSWLSVQGGTNQPIPMTGQITCATPATCKIVSDDKGFAQAWSPVPGGEPEFASDLPFGGMRSFAFEISGNEIKGAVSDHQVQLSDDENNNSIPVKGMTQ